MSLAKDRAFKSIAFPLIGAGTGGGKAAKVESIILKIFESIILTVRCVLSNMSPWRS
jgi:O-acetyl-ADP-ribose deacetylase (regulator of RNase III)